MILSGWLPIPVLAAGAAVEAGGRTVGFENGRLVLGRMAAPRPGPVNRHN